MTYAQTTGKLITPRTISTGRKVDEWTFLSAAPGNHRSKVVVTLESFVPRGQSEHQMQFVARCELLPDIITNTDIKKLETEVAKTLQEQDRIRTQIVWEDWLEIKIRNNDSTYTSKHEAALGLKECCGFNLEVHGLKKGIDPKTGLAWTYYSNGATVPFPKANTLLPEDVFQQKKAEENESLKSKPLFEQMRNALYKENHEVSYLKDTPENRAAITAIVDGMNTLRGRLAQFMNQTVIENTLKMVGQNLAAVSHSGNLALMGLDKEPSLAAPVVSKKPKQN